MTKLLPRCLSFVLLGLVVGCGGGGTAPPEPTASELTEAGWAHFAAGRFQEAAASFSDAIAVDPAFADAYNGRGWASLRLIRFGEALGAFAAALNLGLGTADPLAGRALALRDLEPVDWAATGEAAAGALAADGRYVFSRDPSLDWKDLRLVLGHALFARGDYAGANEQVRLLGGAPADPASETFVLDLLRELERLGTEP